MGLSIVKRSTMLTFLKYVPIIDNQAFSSKNPLLICAYFTLYSLPNHIFLIRIEMRSRKAKNTLKS